MDVCLWQQAEMGERERQCFSNLLSPKFSWSKGLKKGRHYMQMWGAAPKKEKEPGFNRRVDPLLTGWPNRCLTV